WQWTSAHQELPCASPRPGNLKPGLTDHSAPWSRTRLKLPGKAHSDPRATGWPKPEAARPSRATAGATRFRPYHLSRKAPKAPAVGESHLSGAQTFHARLCAPPSCRLPAPRVPEESAGPDELTNRCDATGGGPGRHC